ncbi:hypothetical protein Tco_0167802 [Tanacetum coccineum]
MMSWLYGGGGIPFQLNSDSLPHAHTQTTKTYYKNQDSRIKKAQDFKTKTSANSDIKDNSSETKLRGRILASFQDDAKYEHDSMEVNFIMKELEVKSGLSVVVISYVAWSSTTRSRNHGISIQATIQMKRSVSLNYVGENGEQFVTEEIIKKGNRWPNIKASQCEEGCFKAIEGNVKEYQIRGIELAVVKLSECKRSVNFLSGEVWHVIMNIDHLNGLIEMMEVMEFTLEIYNSVWCLREMVKAENKRLLGLNKHLVDAEEDIRAKEGYLEILEEAIYSR